MMTPEQLAAAERVLAERAVVADIEAEGVRIYIAPDHSVRVYDVRPMLDRWERCDISIDMAAIALAYAEQRGLIEVTQRDMDHQPRTVRILRDPA
jgi:hypothetical protein